MLWLQYLREIWWWQVLYLDGVEQFGEEQLQELVDLMTEKEIRLQIPLEEVELLLASEPQPAEENTQPIWCLTLECHFDVWQYGNRTK